MQHFDNCPRCNEETTSMLISENASKRLDYNHIQNMMVESENWVIKPMYKILQGLIDIL